MKVAVVHDWLVNYGGSERVLEQILNCFPQADLYSVVDFLSQETRLRFNKKIKTTFIQKLPGAKRFYRFYLPLMPLAIEQLDLSGYDLVLSSSHAVAKGVITAPEQFHLTYIHSPMRYIWDLEGLYLKEAKLSQGIKSLLIKFLTHRLRIWDVISSFRVDAYIANSHFIKKRVKKYYRRKAKVVYPPINFEEITPHLPFSMGTKKKDYYFTVSRLVSYKKVDLIIESFKKMPDKKLVVGGQGPEYKKLKRMSQNCPNIELLGYVNQKELIKKIFEAKVFVYAALEDLGIVLLEAQACGTPVIAYGRGGALETVINKKTGILYKEQTSQAIIEAVENFSKTEKQFKSAFIKKQVINFKPSEFRKKFKSLVLDEYKKFKKNF